MSKNSMPGVDSAAARTLFGRNFRAQREKLQLSQREIHRLTSVAASHISEIETGASNVAIDTMVKLATVVKLPLWQLFKQ